MEDGGYGGYFASTNRNKESVVVDLKSPAGRDVILQLAAEADIVIENFRSGVMERAESSSSARARSESRDRGGRLGTGRPAPVRAAGR